MPAAFPSHQGLILPLWRRFPGVFDGVALSVGAAMPDLVDAAAWPFRGELGQWMGHSLIGLVVCVASGFPLLWLVRRVTPRRWLVRLDRGRALSLPLVALSLGVGALSHDAFDLVTHASFLLLWPWYSETSVFPSWWSHPWGSVSLLVYKQPYPLAPHTIAWGVFTVLGAVLFWRYTRRELAPDERAPAVVPPTATDA
jgi:hypothetical protein